MATTVQGKRKPGRPRKYSKRLADRICREIAEGKSLRKICRQSGMPKLSTVMRWLFEDDLPEFRVQYARAREAQAEALADELVDEADRARDRDTAAAAKVRVDARKWVASKLLPKKYGDLQRQEVRHVDAEGKDVTTTTVVVIGDQEIRL